MGTDRLKEAARIHCLCSFVCCAGWVVGITGPTSVDPENVCTVFWQSSMQAPSQGVRGMWLEMERRVLVRVERCWSMRLGFLE